MFLISKKSTNNQLNIFNQDIFKQLSKHFSTFKGIKLLITS